MNNIQLYKVFSQFICELLNLKLPLLYIVQYEKKYIVLYDDELNIISYDERDVGRKVKDVLIIPKQNVIYINKTFSLDIIKTIILISKRLRYMYQLKQITLYSNNELTEIDKFTVKQWRYLLSPSQNQKRKTQNNQISPDELDRKAFTQIVLKEAFNYNIHFNFGPELTNEKVYNDILEKIKNDYPRLLINIIFNKYKEDLRINQ